MRRPVVLVPLAAGALLLALVAYFAMGRATLSAGVELTYACAEPAAVADARIVAARLQDIGAQASVEVIDPNHLRVRTSGEGGTIAFVRSALLARRLEIRAVDEASMRALADTSLPPGVRVEQSAMPELVAASIEPLRAITAPPSQDVVTTCDVTASCHAWVVDHVEIGGGAVQDATMAMSGETPTILVTLTPEARAQFAALTTRTVGGRLLITLDHRVIMAPRVQQPITTGRLSIALGAEGGPDEADAIARALRGASLSCSEWTLATENGLGAPATR